MRDHLVFVVGERNHIEKRIECIHGIFSSETEAVRLALDRQKLHDGDPCVFIGEVELGKAYPPPEVEDEWDRAYYPVPPESDWPDNSDNINGGEEDADS